MTRNVFATVIILALVAGSAHAATVTLTFDDVACHSGTSPGPTNVGCANGLPVGSDYGSTSELTVFFKPIASTGTGQTASQFGSTGDFGVVELGNSAPGPLSEIRFTPAPGYEVSLLSYARRRGTSTLNNANFRLLDHDGAEIYLLDVANNPLEKVTETVNSAFSTSQISFRYGSTQGATRVDDFRLEVRAVPEPSTLAILLGLAVMFRGRSMRG